MAKKLLLDALVRVLGEYIDLDENNLDLTFAVWSGQLKLHNVKLKTQKLFKKFNINILHATVLNLEILIPWTALLNAPVKILIDGVLIQVSPLKENELDHNTAKLTVRARKKEQLDKIDTLLDYGDHINKNHTTEKTTTDNNDNNTDSNNTTEVNAPTMVQIWTSKIVDNIEIQLKNIHIRYEDHYSIPGLILSAGITLSSFTICSCDENWMEKFISRNPSDLRAIIHKLVRIQNFGMYWNMNSKSVFPKDFDSWCEMMIHSIYTTDSDGHIISPHIHRNQSIPQTSTSNTTNITYTSNNNSNTNATQSDKGNKISTNIDSSKDISMIHTNSSTIGMNTYETTIDTLQYIIHPNNNMNLKLKHYDGKRAPNEPKFDIDIYCTHLNIIIDRIQYCQLFHTIDLFQQLQLLKQPISHRPPTRPSRKLNNIIDWWKYAILLIHKKKRYITLMKLYKYYDYHTGEYIDKRSVAEIIEMTEIEDIIPLQNLIVFRHEIAMMMCKERDTHRTNNKISSSSSSSAPAVSTRSGHDTHIGTTRNNEGKSNTTATTTMGNKTNAPIPPPATTLGGYLYSFFYAQPPIDDDVSSSSSSEEEGDEHEHDNDTDIDESLFQDTTWTTTTSSSTPDNLTSAPDYMTKTPTTTMKKIKSMKSFHNKVNFKDDVPLEALLQKLNEKQPVSTSVSAETRLHPKDMLYQFKLSSGASLSLLIRGQPIVYSSLSTKLSGNMTNDSSLSMNCALYQLYVLDKCTPAANIAHIINVNTMYTTATAHSAHVPYCQQDHQVTPSHINTSLPIDSMYMPPHMIHSTFDRNEKPVFTLNVDTDPTQASIKIHALPIEIVLNKICINNILLFVSPPKRYVMRQQTRMKPKVDTSKQLAFVTSKVMSAAEPFLNRDRRASMGTGTLKTADGKVYPTTPSNFKSTDTTYHDTNDYPTNDSSEPSGTNNGFVVNISLEVHAPKIIIPENSMIDMNYLLLDAGFLAINGTIGNTGMSLDVSLSNVNAGLPTSVKNIYHLNTGSQSLYLIKPFEINVNVETGKVQKAGTNVTVKLSPGIHGELDANKLKRLLSVLGEISPIFSVDPRLLKDNFLYMNTTSHTTTTTRSSHLTTGTTGLDLNMTKGMISKDLSTASLYTEDSNTSGSNTGSNSGSHSHSHNHTTPLMTVRKNDLSADTEDSSSSNNIYHHIEDLDDIHEELLPELVSTLKQSTTAAISSNKGDNNNIRGTNDNSSYHVRFETPEKQSSIKSLLPPNTTTITEDNDKSLLMTTLKEKMATPSSTSKAVNPYTVNMCLQIEISDIVLDLTYDLKQGHHLILRMGNLASTITTRAYDMSAIFNMKELSIQDSMRHESQRFLLHTSVAEQDHLVYVSYTNINNILSPLYRQHATLVDIRIADVSMNSDVTTVMHLKPFFDVLLSNKGSSSPPPPSPSSSSSNTSGISPTTILPSTTNTTSHQVSVPLSADSAITPASHNVTLVPKGLLLHCTFHVFSLQFLRVSHQEISQQMLSPAYIWQIKKLQVQVDLVTLLKANVILHSMEVTDIRVSSEDYIFRNIFCPVYETDFDTYLFNATKSSKDTARESDKKTDSPKMKQSPQISGRKSHSSTLPSPLSSSLFSPPISKLCLATSTTTANKESISASLLNTEGNEGTNTLSPPIILSNSGDINNAQGRELTKRRSTISMEEYQSAPSSPITTRHPNTDTNSNNIITNKNEGETLNTPNRGVNDFMTTNTSPNDALYKMNLTTQLTPILPPIINILEVDFIQESKEVTTINVGLNNITSFIVIDTILDFVDVATSNASAYLSLLTPPTPTQVVPTQTNNTIPTTNSSTLTTTTTNSNKIISNPQMISTKVSPRVPVSSHPLDPSNGIKTSHTKQSITESFTKMNRMKNNNDNKTDTISLSTITNIDTTMNINVKISNPRLLVLEDPTTTESAAIMCKSNIHLHISKLQHQQIYTPTPTPTAHSTTSVGVCNDKNMIAAPQSLNSYKNITFNESFHFSLKDSTILLIPTIKTWELRQILGPFGIECNIRKKSINDILQNTSIAVDIDTMKLQASLPDVELIQTILNQRTYMSTSQTRVPSPTAPVPTVNKHPPMSSSSQYKHNHSHDIYDHDHDSTMIYDPLSPDNSTKISPPLPYLSIVINIGPSNMTVVDESNYTCMPILRCNLQDTAVHIEKIAIDEPLEGDCHLCMYADFYNSRIQTWEPVIELWHFTVVITIDTVEGNMIQIYSTQDLQINISGIFLSTIVSTFTSVSSSSSSNINSSIYRHNGDKTSGIKTQESPRMPHLQQHEYNDTSKITLTNYLGIPFDVYTANIKDNQKVLTFTENVSCQLFPPMYKDTMLYSSVNIVFQGPVGGLRQPLWNIPLHISKRLAYHLLPISPTNENDGKNVTLDIHSDEMIHEQLSHSRGSSVTDIKESLTWKDIDENIYEEIQVEVYENHRYEPLSGQWMPPYLLGDPQPWTDSTGKIAYKYGLDTVELPSDEWEWCNQWSVDLEQEMNSSSSGSSNSSSSNSSSGEGGEIDKEGWEYASSFDYFSHGSIRHILTSSDYCRRRKWIRKRATASMLLKDTTRPFTVYWEVKSLHSGEKQIQIRSRLQIKNTMSFPISIALHSDTWTSKKVYGPIQENEIFCVPLLHSYATSIRIKPSARKYKWCKALNCSSDYEMIPPNDTHSTINSNLYTQEIQCVTTCTTKEYMSAIISYTKHENELLLTTHPYIQCINLLPCQLSILCGYNNFEEDSTECYDLDAGSTYKFVSISMLPIPEIAIKCNTLKWSQPIKLNPDTINTAVKDKSIIPISLYNEKQEVVLILSMNIDKEISTGILKLTVYSPYWVLDRTQLSVGIIGYVNNQEVQRYTYPHHQQVVHSTKDSSSLKPLTPRLSYKSDHENTANTPNQNIASNSNTSNTSNNSNKAPTHSPELTLPHVESYITNFIVKSDHKYEIKQYTAVNDSLYTDQTQWRWFHLCKQFKNAYYISTSYYDSYIRIKKLIQFHIHYPSLIVIMINTKVTKLPKWLLEENYIKLVQHNIARKISLYDGKLLKQESISMYAKVFPRNSDVILGGNWSSDTNMMYTVFIVPYLNGHQDWLSSPTINVNMKTSNSSPLSEFNLLSLASPTRLLSPASSNTIFQDTDQLFIQTLYHEKYDKNVSDIAWIHGDSGVTLYYNDKDMCSISIMSGTAWSESLSLTIPPNTLKFFEAIDWKAGLCYQLSYKISYMPGLFHDSKMITIMNRFIIVNQTEDVIYILQKDGRIQDEIEIEPYQTKPFHSTVHATMTTSIIFRTINSLWSFGSIDISEIGSNVLLLPIQKSSFSCATTTTITTAPTPVGSLSKTVSTSSRSLSPLRATPTQSGGSISSNSSTRHLYDKDATMMKSFHGLPSSTHHSHTTSTTPFEYDPSQSTSSCVVLNVDVKLSDGAENGSIIIMITKCTLGSYMPLSIKNDADVPIVIRQADLNPSSSPSLSTTNSFNIDNTTNLPTQQSTPLAGTSTYDKMFSYDTIVYPHQWVPYGWTDADCSDKLLVTTGTYFYDNPMTQPIIISSSIGSSSASSSQRTLRQLHTGQQSGVYNTLNSNSLSRTQRIATVNILTAGECIRLPDNSRRMGPQGEIIISVLVSKRGGRVLRIFRQKMNTSSLYVNEDSLLTNLSTYLPDEDEYSAMNTNEKEYISEDRIYTDHTHSHNNQDNNTTTTSVIASPPLKFDLFLSAINISLIFDKPIRREFMHIMIKTIQCHLENKDMISSIELLVGDLQVDNYSETTIYPVFIHSYERRDWRRRYNSKDLTHTTTITSQLSPHSSSHHVSQQLGHEGISDTASVASTSTSAAAAAAPVSTPTQFDDNKTPILQLSIIKEINTNTQISVFNYIGFRLMPIAIETDSSTLQLLYIDFLYELKLASSFIEIQSKNTPELWINEYNQYTIFAPKYTIAYMDIQTIQKNIQATKIYFKQLTIHPMKIVITFVQSQFPRDIRTNVTLQNTVMNILTTLAGFDRLKIKLKSYHAEDIIESNSSLMDHILNNYKQDISSQFAQIAGSLALFGSPVGFANKIGHGVKAFFYEPYQGLVHSPQEFVLGIGKGTTSLFSEVVSGAMNSTVAMVGTASKGISYLSGDADYIRKRELKQQKARAQRNTTIMEGIVEGSESVLHGFKSGLTGLVTKPIREARRDGVGGFFRGIGMGLVGAAVKPILGLTDGLTTVASSIQSQVDMPLSHTVYRPCRALEVSPMDPNTLVIVPLNLDAALAKEFITLRAESHHYIDQFIMYIPLDEHGHQSIILSNIYIFWKKEKTLWGRTWASISHCVYSDSIISIMLYGMNKTPTTTTTTTTTSSSSAKDISNNATESNDSNRRVDIICSKLHYARKLYMSLHQNAYRMGYPYLTLPLDAAIAIYTQLSQDNQIMEKNMSINNGNISFLHTFHIGMSKVTLFGEVDSYRFGSANLIKLPSIDGPEIDVLKRAKAHLTQSILTWKQLDEYLYRTIWEWDCVHYGLSASRCCIVTLLNMSYDTIQIQRIQLFIGRTFIVFGSDITGYDREYKMIRSGGRVSILICGMTPTPLDPGYIHVKVYTSAMKLTVMNTQMETICESKRGYQTGFIEKTATEWWCKYTILMHNSSTY